MCKTALQRLPHCPVERRVTHMLETLVSTYLVSLEAENRTTATRDWHKNALTKFSAWLKETGQSDNPADWNSTTIRTYYVYLKNLKKKDGQPLAAESVRTYARSIKAFCRWLHAEEFIDKDIMVRVKQPFAPKLIKSTLTAEEFRRALEIAKNSRNGLRDQALLLFMLDTGTRANEVCGLKFEDINWPQRLAKVYGKGGKERHVPFSAATMKAMQRYMFKTRRDVSEYFFQNEEGHGLTTSGLLQLCARIGEKAGVKLNPHKFRHTFSINYLRSGASVFSLQKVLGHTDLSMSLRYSALMSDDLVNDHAKHSPVNSFMVTGKKSPGN